MQSGRTIKNFRHTSAHSKLKQSKATGLFSHSINRMFKKPIGKANPKDDKYKKPWLLKEEADQAVAMREVLAQEFFRLIIPTQHKTRLIHGENGKTYVASQQIEGFQTLGSIAERDPNAFRQCLKNGVYTGLGEIFIVAQLLNEVDLKPANIGINNKNQIIKIDGDWSFAALRGKGFQYSPFFITGPSIDALPFLNMDYHAYNWLDCVVQASYNPSPKMVDHNLSFLPEFRQEINRAILKILVLPDELLDDFISQYPIDADVANSVKDEIKKRKNMLFNAALENNSFLQFLASPESQQVVKDHIAYLKSFKTTKKNKLTVDQLDLKVWDQFRDLAKEVNCKCDILGYATQPIPTFLNCFNTSDNSTLSQDDKQKIIAPIEIYIKQRSKADKWPSSLFFNSKIVNKKIAYAKKLISELKNVNNWKEVSLIVDLYTAYNNDVEASKKYRLPFKQNQFAKKLAQIKQTVSHARNNTHAIKTRQFNRV